MFDLTTKRFAFGISLFYLLTSNLSDEHFKIFIQSYANIQSPKCNCVCIIKTLLHTSNMLKVFVCIQTDVYKYFLYACNCIVETHRCAFLNEFEFCYYTTKMTFGGALAFCRAHNGDLTSINSQVEQDTVQGLVNQTTQSEEVWIGYTDDLCTGINWSNTDGRGGYTNWHAGQPLMATGNCGILWSKNGLWVAKSCLATYQYVCRNVSYRSNSQFAY